MPNFYDAFDKPAPSPAPAPVTPINTPAATRYAAAALQRECVAVATAPEGTRNHTLNKAAFSLGQLVATGHLNHHDTWAALETAAHTAGLDPRETHATLRSGLGAGQQHPRTVQPQETPTWAPLPTPFANASDTPGAATNATDADRYAQAVAQEAILQRIRRDARRQVDAEDAAKAFREPPSRPTLTAELAIPDEPITYRIEQVLPTGGNVLLTAQFKTGKTTLVNNFARSLSDGLPFLGRYNVAALSGRVALFNYEVDERQYRRWLRDTNITDTDNVAVLNLRGYRLPLTTPSVEDWVVRWLIEHEVEVWVVDPFARAYTGAQSENDNAEVGRFLDTLDVIKQRAGVSELILPTHTGRAEFEEGEERARGATRLDDWADVRWFLTKDDSDIRYFRATGRDVETPEAKLSFDETTRQLQIGGGDRAWEKKKRMEDAVVIAVETEPGIGLARLRTAVRSLVRGGRTETVDAAIQAAAQAHRIRIDQAPGAGQATRHFPMLTSFGGAG